MIDLVSCLVFWHTLLQEFILKKYLHNCLWWPIQNKCNLWPYHESHGRHETRVYCMGMTWYWIQTGDVELGPLKSSLATCHRWVKPLWGSKRTKDMRVIMAVQAPCTHAQHRSGEPCVSKVSSKQFLYVTLWLERFVCDRNPKPWFKKAGGQSKSAIYQETVVENNRATECWSKGKDHSTGNELKVDSEKNDCWFPVVSKQPPRRTYRVSARKKLVGQWV
jgi:hypothetical protein